VEPKLNNFFLLEFRHVANIVGINMIKIGRSTLDDSEEQNYILLDEVFIFGVFYKNINVDAVSKLPSLRKWTRKISNILNKISIHET